VIPIAVDLFFDATKNTWDNHLKLDVLDGSISKTPSVKGLLLTNPHNPLGISISKEDIHRLFIWCVQHKIHLIVDEAYAASAWSDALPFVSASHLYDEVPDAHQWLHIIYTFSKDLSLAGFRCGLVYSLNDTILEFAERSRFFFHLSSLNQ